jgi:hypothetical protein
MPVWQRRTLAKVHRMLNHRRAARVPGQHRGPITAAVINTYHVRERPRQALDYLAHNGCLGAHRDDNLRLASAPSSHTTPHTQTPPQSPPQGRSMALLRCAGHRDVVSDQLAAEGIRLVCQDDELRDDDCPSHAPDVEEAGCREDERHSCHCPEHGGAGQGL